MSFAEYKEKYMKSNKYWSKSSVKIINSLMLWLLIMKTLSKKEKTDKTEKHNINLNNS